jgi:hypothetical protein
MRREKNMTAFIEDGVRKIESRKLTPSGNWIPVVTTMKGMLDILKNNIKLMEEKPWTLK